MAWAGCAFLALFTLTGCVRDGGDGPWTEGAGNVRGDLFERASLADGSRLLVTTEGGVRIAGTDDDSVTVDEATPARWDVDAATPTLDLLCDQGDRRTRENCGGMPVVHVPAGVTLTVRARNAGIEVDGVRGPLTLTTVNGDVTVHDSGTKGARQHLVTRNGSVRADGLAARGVSAETVNGDVDLLCTTSPGTLDGVTRNGSVRVTLPADGPPYETDASTVNGRTVVDVPAPATDSADPRHRLTLRTVNGDTEVRRG
ncbi:DUF4097 family beta strand repeat-containing protein [Streptomyces sp. NPDC002734]|uniref:DUF4097 family beta strand repeat-containing protein n=1 Tax=Streptomyces sp. NPDC002734 TaxID=3154426 RepID=UPI00331D58CC